MGIQEKRRISKLLESSDIEDVIHELRQLPASKAINPLIGALCSSNGVKDDGIGFDEKYTDQIFRMFQRLHGRSEYEGTGVGLAVCRKIAERHGVAISARSISGQGAEFALRFACESILSQPTVTN